MFTIKLYRADGNYQRIFQADSFTVIRSSANGRPSDPRQPETYHSEITAHGKEGDLSTRFDIGESPYEPDGGVWEKAIIENMAGRTTEIIGHNQPPKQRDQYPTEAAA